MDSSGRVNFDFVAPFYDRIAKLIFGKSILDSQTFFLPSIPEKSNILILGGGTGWILEELFKCTKDCKIWYLDSSQEMLKRAQSRAANNDIKFICGTERDLPRGIMFDVVILNYFLDMFSEDTLNEVISIILEATKRSTGVWFVTDFISTGKWWQSSLLYLMYQFFRITCRIATLELPQWETALIRHGVHIHQCKTFLGGFIKAEKVYR